MDFVESRLFDVYPSLAGLPETFLREFQHLEKENFFYSLSWFRNLEATTLEQAGGLRIYRIGRISSGTQAILVTKTPASQNGSIFDKDHLRGNTLSGFSNFQTCQFSPLLKCPSGEEPIVMEKLALALCQEEPHWDILDFNALDSKANWLEGFIQGFQKGNMFVVPYSHFGNWYEKTSGWSFQDYVNSRSPSIKKTFKNYARKGRKLEKLGEVRFKIFSEFEEIEQGIQDYESICKNSWKEPDFYPNFTSGFFQSGSSHGVLRMGILYLKDKPIAAEVGLLTQTGVTMVKTAYDNQWKDYSVGALVMMRMIEYLLDVELVEEIDFGRDDNVYKKLWVSQRRERMGIVAFRPSRWPGLKGFIRFQFQEKLKRLKTQIKKIVSPLHLRVLFCL